MPCKPLLLVSFHTWSKTNSMLRSTMSRTKRCASKWLVPGCADVIAAHRTSRSIDVGQLGSGVRLYALAEEHAQQLRSPSRIKVTAR